MSLIGYRRNTRKCLRQLMYVFFLQDERGENSQDPWITARAGQYVVIQQRVSHLGRWPVADEPEQQAHPLDATDRADGAQLANLCFSRADVGQ